MASLPILAGATRRFRIARRAQEPIRPSSPRPERRDSHGRLCTALLQLAGPGAFIEGGARPWHSATFVGAQHRLSLIIEGEEAAARIVGLATALPEAEFAIPGHVVVDVVIDGIEHEGLILSRLLLCILTIEDW